MLFASRLVDFIADNTAMYGINKNHLGCAGGTSYLDKGSKRGLGAKGGG